MIDFNTKMDRERIRAVERLADKGVFRSLGNAAAALRSTARRLIRRVANREPSHEGEPVHTRFGQAKRTDAILFDVDGDEAVVGFTYSVMGDVMGAHEQGGEYMGTEYPERPTMGPAMDANLVRFADEFRGSIGE